MRLQFFYVLNSMAVMIGILTNLGVLIFITKYLGIGETVFSAFKECSFFGRLESNYGYA